MRSLIAKLPRDPAFLTGLAYLSFASVAVAVPGGYLGTDSISARTAFVPVLSAIGLMIASPLFHYSIPERMWLTARADDPRIVAVALALEAVGVMAVAVRFIIYGVPLFGQTDVSRLALVAGDPPVILALGIVLLQVAPALALAAALPCEGSQSRGSMRTAFVLGVVSAVLLLALGNRLRILALLGYLALVVAIRGVRVDGRWIALSAGAGGAFLGVYALLRTVASKGSGWTMAYLERSGLGWIPAPLAWLGMLAISFRNPMVTSEILVARFPAEQGHTWGWFTFGELLSLLPGKQELPEHFVTTQVLNGEVSRIGATATPFPTGLYVDWGYLGVLAGSVAAGLAVMALWKAARESRDAGLAVATSVVIFSLVVGAYGSLPFSITNVWQVCVMLGVTMVSARVRPRE